LLPEHFYCGGKTAAVLFYRRVTIACNALLLVIKCKDSMDKCLYLSWRLSFAGRSEKNAAGSGDAQI
jgi:galactitol-specific phosphotransferase system IIC component